MGEGHPLRTVFHLWNNIGEHLGVKEGKKMLGGEGDFWVIGDLCCEERGGEIGRPDPFTGIGLRQQGGRKGRAVVPGPATDQGIAEHVQIDGRRAILGRLGDEATSSPLIPREQGWRASSHDGDKLFLQPSIAPIVRGKGRSV